jgi:hypothetical protein
MRFQNGCNQPMHFDKQLQRYSSQSNLFASYDGQRLTYSNDPSSTNTLTTLPDFSDESLILEEVQNSRLLKSPKLLLF